MSGNIDWNDGEVVIDLTNSFTYVDHGTLRNAVIEIDTDDSYIEGHTAVQDENFCLEPEPRQIQEEQVPIPVPSPNRRKRAKGKKSSSFKKENQEVPSKRPKKNEKPKGFGECPICCEELGIDPMASTKCGHVFCLKCLQKSLKIQRKCPTCRKVLSAISGYHPLYL